MVNNRISTRQIILFAGDLSAISQRRQLAGVLREIMRQPQWELRIIQAQDDFTATRIKYEIENKVTALITAFECPSEIIQLLRQASIPVILFDQYRRESAALGTKITHIRIDNERIATLALQHLISSCSPKSLGYVPDVDKTKWNELRQSAFRREAAKCHLKCEIFTKGSANQQADHDALRRWLTLLPKPTALFCANDQRAARVAAACDTTQLSIPENVCIIGADNDEFFCDSLQPSLSSIAIDFVGEGRLAGRELLRMISGHSAKPKRIVVHHTMSVMQRQSTTRTGDPFDLATRSLRYISQNALNGISADDVANHFHVSRRLLDLRLSEHPQATTASRAIEDFQLKEVQRLLRESKYSIQDLALRCGYSNPNSLRNRFRQRFGISIGKFRTLNSINNPRR